VYSKDKFRDWLAEGGERRKQREYQRDKPERIPVWEENTVSDFIHVQLSVMLKHLVEVD
jgi:hypothetical protein